MSLDFDNEFCCEKETSLTPLVNVRAKCDRFIERFVSHHKQSAESFIAACVTLIDAKRELSDEEFLIFRNRLDINDSYHKKLRVVGQSELRLRYFLDRLPNNWTTIY